MAVDFLSIPNLKRSRRLVSELRMQRLADGVGDDVLQLYTTLWYAWVALSSLYKSFPSGEPPDADMAYGDNFPTPLSTELPAMLVDKVPSTSTIVGDQLLEDAISNPTDSTFALSATHIGGQTARRQQRQLERNKRRRNRKHQDFLLAARPPRPGFDLECPSSVCERKLNQLGLLDHV
jgi:hypothetical protein